MWPIMLQPFLIIFNTDQITRSIWGRRDRFNITWQKPEFSSLLIRELIIFCWRATTQPSHEHWVAEFMAHLEFSKTETITSSQSLHVDKKWCFSLEVNCFVSCISFLIFIKCGCFVFIHLIIKQTFEYKIM